MADRTRTELDVALDAFDVPMDGYEGDPIEHVVKAIGADPDAPEGTIAHCVELASAYVLGNMGVVYDLMSALPEPVRAYLGRQP